MTAIIVGSNLDTPDMRDLPDHALLSADAFYMVAAKGRPGHSRPPNTFEALRDSGFFRRLGLPFILEEGMSKAWYHNGVPVLEAWHGELFRDLIRESTANIRAAGGIVKAVAFDEPLTAAVRGRTTGDEKITGFSYHQLAEIEAITVREMKDLDLACYHLEPYPHLSTAQILGYFTTLRGTGWLPKQFIWDIDPGVWARHWWHRWMPYGLASAAVQRDLRTATARMQDEFGMEVGVVIKGQSSRTQAEYAASVHTLSRALRVIWPNDEIDAVYVVNWTEPVDEPLGPRTMPNNLPIEDPTSQLGILQTVTAAWAA